MTKSINTQSRQLLKVEVESYLLKINKTIKQFLQYSPYYNDKVMMHNIYISCMLTLLNQITLSNANKKRMQNRLDSMYNMDAFLNTIYLEEQQNSTILFHLPQHLSNYITTLVNEMKILIVDDLKFLIGSSEPTEAVMQAIMQSTKESIINDQE